MEGLQKTSWRMEAAKRLMGSESKASFAEGIAQDGAEVEFPVTSG